MAITKQSSHVDPTANDGLYCWIILHSNQSLHDAAARNEFHSLRLLEEALDNKRGHGSHNFHYVFIPG